MSFSLPSCWRGIRCTRPVIRSSRTTSAAVTIRLSGLASDRSWRSTPMYTDVLRRLGGDDQLSARIPGRHFVRGVTLCRVGGRYSESERDSLYLLLPHLRHAIDLAVRAARQTGDAGPLLRMTPSIQWTELQDAERHLIQEH